MDQPIQYQIKVKGHLDSSWVNLFDGLAITNLENGEALLSGTIRDQATLQGALSRISNLGLTLISVNPIPDMKKVKGEKMNTKNSKSNLISRRILRIHGTFLLVLTVINTILAMIGWGTGKGPFALWQEIPFAAVGLFQAYLIMFVVGVALWFGSSLETDLWKWDLIGLLAHIPPLAVNFIFSGLFTAYHFQGASLFSIILHTVWITIETFAILYKGQDKKTMLAI